MSGKQFLVLLLLFGAYLLLGASVFHLIEQAKEIEQAKQERHEAEAIVKILNETLDETTLEDELMPKLREYCGKSFNVDPDRADPFKWHFYNAVFFVITVVSTIGYGNLAPTTALSRILMIFYGLVGIPMNGILLKSLADYFGHFFLRARDKYKTHHHNGISLAWSVLFYLSLGLLVFMLCPSFIFMYFEGWTFDESLYYAFVSLTTIGFGDLVAGQKVDKRPEYIVYKVFLIMWLVFGLGYLFMVLGFITDAMRSKRMAKLSKGIAHTQTKLWHGMVHEMPHLLRRVLNELYLLKVKPVYHDDNDFGLAALARFERCSSCPDLFWLDEAYKSTSPFPVVVGVPGSGYRRASRVAAGRPRALSEVLPGPGRLLLRRRSETELCRIDRRATFADATVPEAGLDPAELLHEFMNALVNWGGGVPNDESYSSIHGPPGTALPSGGYQGFADADILSSEWAQQKEQVLRRGARQRAKSLAPFSAANEALAEARYGHGGYGGQGGYGPDEDFDDSATLPADEAGNDQDGANNAEWTWSGVGASKRVHELIRARQHRRRSEAVIRKQQRHGRRLQELQDFQRLRELEEMRQLDKEARSLEKRRARTLSTGAAETGSGLATPKTSVGGLMQRLAIPQRLKDLARRRRSLQPDGSSGQDADGDADDYADDYAGDRYLQQRRRSPSYDPVRGVAPAHLFAGADPYRTHTAGESLLSAGSGFDPTQGRRDSIFRRNSATVHPVLENTSLAEFLRVLQSVQRQQTDLSDPTASVQATLPPQAPPTPGKTRKLGTAGLSHQPQHNSLFKVFPGLDAGRPEKRRASLRPSSPPPGAMAASHAAGATPTGATATGKRRMSFWPSFGSSADSAPAAPSLLVSPTAARRRSSTARRLSSFLGVGTCTDPDPGDEPGDPGPPKVTKKRRFSIWPTLGVMGRGGGADKDPDEKPPPPPPPPAGLGAVEDGRGGDADVYTLSASVPQITVTYVNDVPPVPPVVPAPRETLRRQALTNNLPTIPAYVPGAVPLPPTGPQDAGVTARLRYSRTSPSGAPPAAPSPSLPRRPSHGQGYGYGPGRLSAAPQPGRRGPSVPSPLFTSDPAAVATAATAAHRRRAFSESTRTRARGREQSDNGEPADGNAGDDQSQRL